MLIVDRGVSHSAPVAHPRTRYGRRRWQRASQSRMRLVRRPAGSCARSSRSSCARSGIAVRDHDLPQAALVVDHVDDAVVGEARHEQSRERIEGCVDVDRRSEDGARLVDELRPLARLPIGGDVVDDVDHVLDGAVAGDDRRRADERPALLAVRQEPVADEALLGLAGDDRATVREGRRRRAAPGRRRSSRKRCIKLRPGEPEQLVARRQPEQARGGVVRIGERAVHALRRDPLGDVVEDDVELGWRRSAPRAWQKYRQSRRRG